MSGIAVWSLALLASTASASVVPRQGSSSSYPQALQVGPPPQQAWIARYNQAKAAGLIPNIPPSTLVNGNPTYPAGSNMTAVCSWTLSYCFGPDDTENGPDGTLGVTFDDGPTQDSPTLYNFLQQNKVNATHFMIGSNILTNPTIFKQALTSGGHIAVHTWSHRYTTSLTDMQVLGELGWTQQIISDYSGGYVSAYWRPPYGDVDNRVRAIAKYVFGMKTIIWNQDTSDWCLNGSGVSSCAPPSPQNPAGLDAEIRKFIAGPKSPGLVLLEHELNKDTVGAFIRSYPNWISSGWVLKSIPDLWNVAWYLNAFSGHDTPTALAIGSGNVPLPNLNAAASATSSLAPASVVTSTSTVPQTTSTSTAMTSSTTSSAATAAAQSNGSSKTSNASVPPEPYETGKGKNGASTMAPVGGLALVSLVIALVAA